MNWPHPIYFVEGQVTITFKSQLIELVSIWIILSVRDQHIWFCSCNSFKHICIEKTGGGKVHSSSSSLKHMRELLVPHPLLKWWMIQGKHNFHLHLTYDHTVQVFACCPLIFIALHIHHILFLPLFAPVVSYKERGWLQLTVCCCTLVPCSHAISDSFSGSISASYCQWWIKASSKTYDPVLIQITVMVGSQHDT